MRLEVGPQFVNLDLLFVVVVPEVEPLLFALNLVQKSLVARLEVEPHFVDLDLLFVVVVPEVELDQPYRN